MTQSYKYYNMNTRESELLREAAIINVVRPLIKKFLSGFAGPYAQTPGASKKMPDAGNLPSNDSKSSLERAVYVAKYLMKYGGLKDFQAAACAGVYMDENGCNPSKYMKAEAEGKGSPSTQNGGYGAGIGSWTGVKTKTRVLQSVGYDPDTKIESLPLNVQCEMVAKEINGHMKKYYDALKRTTNIEDASATAIFITGGIGYAQREDPNAWKTHPTWDAAVRTMEKLGTANDNRFGYSKHHHGGAERRLAKAKQVLQAMGGSVA